MIKVPLPGDINHFETILKREGIFEQLLFPINKIKLYIILKLALSSFQICF